MSIDPILDCTTQKIKIKISKSLFTASLSGMPLRFFPPTRFLLDSTRWLWAGCAVRCKRRKRETLRKNNLHVTSSYRRSRSVRTVPQFGHAPQIADECEWVRIKARACGCAERPSDASACAERASHTRALRQFRGASCRVALAALWVGVGIIPRSAQNKAEHRIIVIRRAHQIPSQHILDRPLPQQINHHHHHRSRRAGIQSDRSSGQNLIGVPLTSDRSSGQNLIGVPLSIDRSSGQNLIGVPLSIRSIEWPELDRGVCPSNPSSGQNLIGACVLRIHRLTRT
jgi:hypothetical protein